MKISVLPFSSQNSHIHWGQHFISHTLYGVIEMVPSQHAQKLGIQTINLLTREFQKRFIDSRTLESMLFEAFNESVLSLCGIWIQYPVIHVSVMGGGGLLLKRKSICSELVSSHGSTEGSLKPGDMLIACNYSAWDSLHVKEREQLSLMTSIHEVYRFLQSRMTDASSGASGCMLVCGDMPKEIITSDNPNMNSSNTNQNIHKKTIQKSSKFYRVLFSVPIRKILLIILGAVFVLSIVFGIQRETRDLQASSYLSSYPKAKSLYEEGVALTEKNSKKAKESLDNAKSLLIPLTYNYSEHTLEGSSIRDLLTKIDSQTILAKKIELLKPTLFYDYSLLKSSSSIRMMTLSQDNMIFLSTDGSIAQVSPMTKEASIIGSISSYGLPLGISAHGDEIYIFVSEGVVALMPEEKPRIVIQKDSEWGNILTIQVYGGNIYLLDSKHNQIWRYQGQEDGTFGERGEYLNPDTLPDFSSSVSMNIDGSIWVWNDIGEISRFSFGKEVSYMPDGVEPALGKRLMLSTDETAENIYILDKDNSRIVVTNKDGVYVRQYQYQNLNPTDILVDEKSRRIYLLIDGFVYVADMK